MAREHPLSKIRNIGIMAHIDAGKTTVQRAHPVLLRARPTRSARCTTARPPWTGWTRSRSAASPSPPRPRPPIWRDHQITLIDTPGHVDFTVEVERSLRVLDGAIALFCAVGGVQPQSEKVWRQSEKYSVPKIAFVNKMDRIGADFFGVVEEIQKELGANAVPVVDPDRQRKTSSGASSTWSRMKAVYYDEDDQGQTFREEDDPGGHAGGGRAVARQPGREMRRAGRRAAGEVPRDGRPDRGRRSWASSARPPSRAASCPSTAARPSRTRASSGCSTASSTACPRPNEIPPIICARGDEANARDPADDGPVLGPGLQDRGRQAHGQADLHPRLLRHARSRARTVLQQHAATRPSASAASSACTPTARRPLDEAYAGDIVAVVGLGDTQDRRHALRRGPPDPPRGHRVPGAGHLHQHRAGHAGATARSWARPCTGWPTRIRPSPWRFDARDQRDDHLRHGRAAPRDHRRPPEARVQRGARRSAGPRWPTARPPPRRSRASTSTSSRPAAAASTAHVVHAARARCGPGSGFEFVNEVVGGRIPPSTSRRSRRA